MDDDDDDISDESVRKLVDAAAKCAESLKRLSSAFYVFGVELREHVEAHHPELFTQPTSSGEIADCAIARAKKRGQM